MNSPSDLAVVVAESRATMRQALIAVLRGDPRVDARGVGDVLALERAIAQGRPQVIVLHRGMLGVSDREAVERLRRIAPGARIMLSGMQRASVLRRVAEAAGADDHLALDADADEILADVLAVAGHAG